MVSKKRILILMYNGDQFKQKNKNDRTHADAILRNSSNLYVSRWRLCVIIHPNPALIPE